MAKHWRQSSLATAGSAVGLVAAVTVFLTAGLGVSRSAHAEEARGPVPVELRETPQGWQLYRGGEPYFIRGAGGDASLEALAAAGANSVRTWGGEVDEVLDQAQALGLTVTVGIWLGHPRHGFDYGNPAQVEKQLARAEKMVLRYRNHPALLLWGVGNEAEGFDEATDPKVWKAINDVAAMVKETDPHHPTMTVTAFVHGERIEYIHERSPAIDIHGINAYGGAQVVPERLQEKGASKPYVLTEFGPLGPWETHSTEWGAPHEQTSEEKAAFYRATYEHAVDGQPGRTLGAYAFLWGHKMEGTDTWFGMFLPDGASTAAVDTMSTLWSGKAPADRAPTIAALTVAGEAAVKSGDVVEVSTRMADPDGGDLRTRWVLRAESGEYATGGDFRSTPLPIEDAILSSSATGARVRMPEAPGPYRLFAYAYDESGKAGTANVPLLVKGERRTPLPFPVYEDSLEQMAWVPSGWMGGVEHLSLDGDDTSNPHRGKASIRVRYEGQFGWAGIAWQHPVNNWGDQEGGIDLTGARKLEFWARGEYGGEKVSFGVGLLESDKKYPDSSISKSGDIVLTDAWQRYEIRLRGKDLSSLKTGFYVTLVGRTSPVTIYLDSIRFTR
ncbi:MAG: glycoside hydrolase family 2 TIM barrel-domain containing protein [Pseudomonadota bacterium]